MRSLLLLTACCISLVSLPQLLAQPVEERPDMSRLDFPNGPTHQRKDKASVSGRQTAAAAVPSVAPSQPPKWLPGFLRHQPAAGARGYLPGLAWARSIESSQSDRRVLRARRHAHPGSHGHYYPQHAKLMRVGCVLGTCQVHNLSHRLYQLLGQSGRDDSSPINPKSPHSYG